MKIGRILRSTLQALFEKPATIQYLTKPGEMVPIPERFRGRIAYDKNACIGCLLCIRVCPGGAITSTVEKKVKFEVAKCIFCGQCVEICPKKAIILSSDFEIIIDEKTKLIIQ